MYTSIDLPPERYEMVPAEDSVYEDTAAPLIDREVVPRIPANEVSSASCIHKEMLYKCLVH